jgi:DNA-binding CsgD family transcriptional regulator
LRRLVLREPIRIRDGSLEAHLIGACFARKPDGPATPSVVDGRLCLAEYAMELVTLDARPAALLIVDRPGPVVDAFDRSYAASLAIMLSAALTRVALRSRLANVSAELRHLTAFTNALMVEATEAPVTLQSALVSGSRSYFVEEAVAPGSNHWQQLMSPQELRVAQLLARGLANREIAGQLVLSVETVKSHVSSILRKLNAANRSHAVALMLAGPRDGDTNV